MTATCILLIVIDRMEFTYYPFQGVKKYVSFLCCFEPIILSWWVHLISIQMQHFLWTVVLFIWLPEEMNKPMYFVMGSFALCVIEFPLTYGIPIAKLPLPWQWYFPLSCSLLRLASIMYFITEFIRQALKEE